MVSIDHVEGHSGPWGGWHNATVGPRQPIPLDPAASVLHYLQEIFEGMKAYRQQDGGLGLCSFRPQANAARFNASATRMAMPHMPEVNCLSRRFAKAGPDRPAIGSPAWEGGSLYLRPFMFATEAFLGVPSSNSCIASLAGNYFKLAVRQFRSDQRLFARRPLRTGRHKTGGNYAASLVPTAEAFRAVTIRCSSMRW
jgi:branched-chain amino acid aminotransferase